MSKYNELIDELISKLNTIKDRKKDLDYITDSLFKFLRNRKPLLEDAIAKGYKFDVRIEHDESQINLLQWDSDAFKHEELIHLCSDNLYSTKDNIARDLIGYQKVAVESNFTVKQHQPTKIYSSSKLIITKSTEIKREENKKDEVVNRINFIIYFKPEKECEFLNKNSSKLNTRNLYAVVNPDIVGSDKHDFINVQLVDDYGNSFYGLLNETESDLGIESYLEAYKNENITLQYIGKDKKELIDAINKWIDDTAKSNPKITNKSIELIFDRVTSQGIDLYSRLESKRAFNQDISIGYYDINQLIADAFELKTAFTKYIDRGYLVESMENGEVVSFVDYHDKFSEMKNNKEKYFHYNQFIEEFPYDKISVNVLKVQRLFKLFRGYSSR